MYTQTGLDVHKLANSIKRTGYILFLRYNSLTLGQFENPIKWVIFFYYQIISQFSSPIL